MLLVDQKADVLLSKIDFAERKIKAHGSPDEVLGSYLKDLADWLATLKDQVRSAQNEFREFMEETKFSELDFLRGEGQKGLLRDMLRTYEGIEESFYLGVDTFLPLIPIWVHQRNDEDTKSGHRLLVHFIQGLLQLSRVPKVMITTLGETYACLPLSWGNIMRHIVFVTYSEMESLRRWVLLTHEIGHAFYDLHFEEFYSRVIPFVMRKLVDTKPINVGQRELEEIIHIWTVNWIPELVSDCFSVKTLGPSYVVQFIPFALDSEPDRPTDSHPPVNLRINFMLDTLESLGLPGFDSDFYRSIWNSYSRSITRPSSQYILHEEVVEAALGGINTVMSEMPIKGKWHDILAARQALSDGKVPAKDLVSTVSAVALIDPTINLHSVYRVLLERYTPCPDAP